MILMYHKVDVITPSRWWVSSKEFNRQMCSLKKNYQFVYLDDYQLDNRNQVVLTFDDAYENVFNHAFPILRKHNIPFELFVNGDLLEKWNEFDQNEVKTRCCSLNHLEEMSRFGGRIQWHSKSHKYLPGLSDDELENQLTIDNKLKTKFSDPHFRWFSYPYGAHDDRVTKAVKQRFCGALSVVNGSDSDLYQLNRVVGEQSWSP